MGNSIFFLMSTVLVLGCVIMGLVFFVFPLPSISGLRNYRISLKVLAIAYFLMGSLSTLPFVLELQEVRLLSPIDMVAASLQAIMFTFTLITLFNPSLVNRMFIFKHLFPVLLFIVLWSVFSALWGSPDLHTLTDLQQNMAHPTVLLCEIFALFYLFQLIYYTWMFHSEARKYDQHLDNYFADNYRLHLRWVSHSFYAALVVGATALLSFFFYSPEWVTTTTGIYAFFYIGFGLFYIQYPNTFIEIEKVIEDDVLILPEEIARDQRQLVWDELRKQVIDEKYYLNSGVNIEEMAQHLKIGRTTLSSYINKEEGMNFYLWINILRIEEAQQIFIQNPGISIAKVSEMVGFTEHSNFSRQFKLVAKISPSEWRQQLKV